MGNTITTSRNMDATLCFQSSPLWIQLIACLPLNCVKVLGHKY